MTLLEGKKTYTGILLAVAPTIAGLFGYDISTAAVAEAGTLLDALIVNANEIITTGGALLAWYGRAVTKANA